VADLCGCATNRNPRRFRRVGAFYSLSDARNTTCPTATPCRLLFVFAHRLAVAALIIGLGWTYP